MALCFVNGRAVARPRRGGYLPEFYSVKGKVALSKSSIDDHLQAPMQALLQCPPLRDEAGAP